MTTDAELDKLDARCVELIQSREANPVEAAYRERFAGRAPSSDRLEGFLSGWTAALVHRPAPADLREAVAESIASMVNKWFGDANKAPPFPAELIARRLDRLALVSAPRPIVVTDLDRAWRAVDALGGPWPSDGDLRDHHMEEGYNRALDEACKAIEKLGGRNPQDSEAVRVAPRAVTDADVERALAVFLGGWTPRDAKEWPSRPIRMRAALETLQEPKP